MQAIESPAEALAMAAGHLDTASRAWVVGIGKFAQSEGIDAHQAFLKPILEESFALGYFPQGPFSYVSRSYELEDQPEFARVILRADHKGEPHLEYQIAIAPMGFIRIGLTRSGRLGSGPVSPSHVLLSDVESLLLDVALLGEVTGRQTGQSGELEIAVGIVSEVPGQPLRLRAFDESTGELCPPLAGDADQVFTPVGVRIDRALGEAEVYAAVFQAGRAIAAQFGASPQFMPHPDLTDYDYFDEVSSR